ncbi:MAG TPA: phospholipase D-like domain-containing protein [Candidatus Saccharimonadales bacterium]|nr:phospholipase D-like domain-containing protein [Candidatus Saccharimonadales bacterium]
MSLKKWMIVSLFLCACYIQAPNQVFFTPRDDIKSQLIKLIKEERKSIDAAMYMFTDKTMAQALVDAYVRGVKIRLVLDQISMGEQYGKGTFLQKNGVTVFVHTSSGSTKAMSTPIMHHKFFIFGLNEKVQKGLLWTGSFNCTASASFMHDENAIVIDDPFVIAQYQECFLQLVHRISPGRGIAELQTNAPSEETITKNISTTAPAALSCATSTVLCAIEQT